MILNNIKFQDKVIFTKHLGTMVKAGIPIVEALSTLATNQKSKYFTKVLKQVTFDVENGKSLADALKKHKDVFNQFYISLVEVGEESGSLEENLEYLTEQLQKESALKKKVKGALLYPGIVLMAAVLVGTFMAFFILPKLVDFFEAFETELPLPTKILLWVATITKNYGVWIILGVIFFIILASFVYRIYAVNSTWHRIVLKIPMIGNLILYDQLSRFSRNLGILISRGVSVTRAFEVTVATLSNIKFKNDMDKVRIYVSEGKQIGEILSKKQYSGYPVLMSRMISVGEKTGKLDETLLYLSEFYDDEIDDISKNFSTVIEPIMLLLIGLAVGFVAIAIISPIYELTGSIRR